jgi:hypothetical protein
MTEKQDYYIRLGIAVRIPIAFKRFCENKYLLKETPLGESQTEEEAKINKRFEIYSKDEVKQASFTPMGEYQCFVNEFKPIFDQIVEELGYAAYKAKKAQEEYDERMLKEMDKKFKLPEK